MDGGTHENNKKVGNIDEAKKNARTIFYVSCILGLLPVMAHGLIWMAIWIGAISVPSALPFENQNWLGHMIVFALAVISGTVLNMVKMDRGWNRQLQFNFINWFAGVIILWLLFGVLAVSGGHANWTIALVTLLGIVFSVFSSYIVDMRVAVLLASK